MAFGAAHFLCGIALAFAVVYRANPTVSILCSSWLASFLRVPALFLGGTDPFPQ